MKKWKDILLHSVPVVLLALGAVLGLTAEEQNALTQAITAVIGGVFTALPIVLHHQKKKQEQ